MYPYELNKLNERNNGVKEVEHPPTLALSKSLEFTQHKILVKFLQELNNIMRVEKVCNLIAEDLIGPLTSECSYVMIKSNH